MKASSIPQRFNLRHTDHHDPQTPNLNFGAVLFVSDDFGSHPVGQTNHSSPLHIGQGTETKVSCKTNSQHIPAIIGFKGKCNIYNPGSICLEFKPIRTEVSGGVFCMSMPSWPTQKTLLNLHYSLTSLASILELLSFLSGLHRLAPLLSH